MSSYKNFLNSVADLETIDLSQPIIPGETEFTLRSWNWVPSAKNNFTFMYGDGEWYGSDDNVSPNGVDSLEEKYQFVFTKENCLGDQKKVNYGDKVHLKQKTFDKYAQCGAGTCNFVNSPGDCKIESWKTFTIVSNSGKSGPVKFGDDIRIQQTVGTNCSITTAGDKATWCTDGSHNNSLMIIYPPTGTIYKNYNASVNSYDTKIRDNQLAKLNPFASTMDSIGNFFGNFFGTLVNPIFIVIIIAVIVMILIIRFTFF